MDPSLNAARVREPERLDAVERGGGPDAHLVALRARLAECERLLRQAEERNTAKVEFLARVSHEIRTPLNAIGGYVDLLLLEIHGPLTEAQRKALGRVQTVQHMMLTLISDLLSFTRLETGHIEYRIEDVPLREVLDQVGDAILPQLQAQSIRYAVQCPHGLLVRADRERLEQILLNLLSNALKFTPGAGSIELRTRLPGDDPRRVRIDVVDSGCGIAPEDVERIFQAFVQVDQRLPGQSGEHGLGLGLAISRDLARQMGGEIAVESAPGEGSTFTLVMPRSAPAILLPRRAVRRTSRADAARPR
jgi:signal transduction histidine kinase